MEKGERHLRRPPQKCQWSPHLRNSAIILRYWLLRLREVQRSEDYSSTFLRWQSKIQIHDPDFQLPLLGQSLSLDQVREHLNKATRHFRQYQNKTTPMRLKTYQDLLAIYQDDDNPDTTAESRRKAKILKHTISGETSRNIFGHLRRIVKPLVTSSLSKLHVPTPRDSAEYSSYAQTQHGNPDDLMDDNMGTRGH
jgi:hypothetical protein